MPSLRSILSLLALGSVMVDNPMPQLLIARALRVVALVVFTSMLIGAFLIAIIGYAYQMTVSQGIPPLEAGLYMMGIIFLIAVVAILITIKCVKHLLDAVKNNAKKPVPLTTVLTNQAGDVVEAFVNGFLSRYKK